MTLSAPGAPLPAGRALPLWGAPGFADFRDWSFASGGGAASSGGSTISTGHGGASGSGLAAAADAVLLPSDELGSSEEPDGGALGLGGAASLDLRDLLTASLLDEVVGLSLDDSGASSATPAAAAAGEAPAGGSAGTVAAATPRPPRRREHDPDATEFLFHLVTSVHEDAYEAARGEGGAGYRRQIAAEAVEAIEALLAATEAPK